MTFQYLTPTDDQMRDMHIARQAATAYAQAIHMVMTDGPDKTYVLRKLREAAMWVNIGITRQPDGTPRG
jgi:hypothetical protein